VGISITVKINGINSSDFYQSFGGCIQDVLRKIISAIFPSYSRAIPD